MVNDEVIAEVLNQFGLRGVATPHGTGHIHDTYRLRNAHGPDHLLQRINHRVFGRVPEMMDNIRRVTQHLRGKDIPSLILVPTLTGELFCRATDGSYWRVFDFIDQARSYDRVQSPAQAREGGRAFGQFIAALTDLPGPPLCETIPNFHQVEVRFQEFAAALAADRLNRAMEVHAEIDFVTNRADEMASLVRQGRAGTLPVRTVHNDTKFNNVLLDAHDRARCVVDLDTVMPGFVAYDFGDTVRTLANTADEDEADLSKINFDLPLFTAFAEGFLEPTRPLLTPAELTSLAFGCKLLPYLQGLRFLTGYLDGDPYHKIHFPTQNRQRARAQLHLVIRVEAQYDNLLRVVTG